MGGECLQDRAEPYAANRRKSGEANDLQSYHYQDRHINLPGLLFFLTITRINVCDSGGGRSTMHTKPPTLLLHIDSQIGRCKERPRIPALDDTHHKARLVAWISSSMVVSYDAISQAWEHLH